MSHISSLDRGSFGINQYDVNIQQQNTPEVADTETVMYDNEELYSPSTQDILNLFAVVYLSSHSSYD